MSITPEIELEDGNFPECPSCYAEIDTWPIEKRAIERERERIIALLEAKRIGDCWCDDYGGYSDTGPDDFCESCRYTITHITLIKGEEQ